MNRIALAARLARRELRSGLSGFRIFFACLVLGVAAIAGVGSFAQGLLSGMQAQGRVLLGGDVSVELVHRSATPDERAFFARYGRVSEATSMRGMAYALKNGAEAERQLIELKSVDGAYPLYGAVGFSSHASLHSALACTTSHPPLEGGSKSAQQISGRGDASRPIPSSKNSSNFSTLPQGEGMKGNSSATICGAVAEQTLLDRLNLRVGGLLRIGSQNFRIAAVLNGEPDRISGGFSLGPHVLISDTALRQTGLVVLGSLIEYRYRIALASPHTPTEFREAARRAYPDAGWQVRDRNEAAPGLKRLIEQITMFLTLVGLTALAVAGVGAGQAVSAFLDRKRAEIATLKSLGAEGGLVFLVFFLQVMAIAVMAVLVGLAVGAALPFALNAAFGAELPVKMDFAIYPAPLALAAMFGLLSAAAFAIPPLARAREIPPASLFRDIVAPTSRRGRLPYLAAALTAALIVVALAFFISPSPMFAGWFLAGVAGALIVLRIIAAALRFGLRRAPRPKRPALRLALANLTRPGAATAGIVVALGLGLTLLAAVTLIDHTIQAQVVDTLPEKAPTFFFVDIQPDEAAAFDKTIARFRSATDYKRTPMIRGRITALNGVPSAKANVEPGSRWALNGDRGITYAASPPKDNEITAGKWWAANYTGPTLISFDAELAQGMHLKLGDTITLNVLGREITGRIANFRDVDFSNGRQNFVLILSPGIIDKAPHSFLATVRVPDRDEEAMYRAITDRFQNVSTVRVKDAIAQVSGLVQEMAAGIRAASLVTILAGLLVLAGAVAAGQRARIYDSTVLKVLGATRAHIAGIYAMEYGLIGAVTGVIALGAGTLGAWLVARQVFEVPFVFDLRAALFTIIGGGAATLLFGLGAAWAALSTKPASLLRNP
jgi:putative ABC transport system permease protein